MAMPRARGGTSPSTRWSPMWISPDEGRSRPAIIRSRVVLPEPEEPSSTRNSPSRIDRLTPSTACGERDDDATEDDAGGCSDEHGFPSLTAGGGPFIGTRVIRRRAAREPLAERGRLLCQAPLLEDRQRHRAHAAFAGPGHQALL